LTYDRLVIGDPHLAGVSVWSQSAAVLDGLFPPFARGAVARVADGYDSPFMEERDAVARAAPSRRREFLCGRACAHAALEALGRDGGPIAVGDRREPSWPNGVVGSISHAGAFAGAVVAHAMDARGVGLDIELLEPPLDSKLRRLLLMPGEISHVDALEAVEPRAAKIVFSAKECVYKCLPPHTGWRLDPKEIDVALDPERGRFRAVIAGRSDGGGPWGGALEGGFRLLDGYVVTAIHV
jgi:4'-phosphopantetheinyl transferase EntD